MPLVNEWERTQEYGAENKIACWKYLLIRYYLK